MTYAMVDGIQVLAERISVNNQNGRLISGGVLASTAAGGTMLGEADQYLETHAYDISSPCNNYHDDQPQSAGFMVDHVSLNHV